jgi:anti-anti-sigma regulatory factor
MKSESLDIVIQRKGNATWMYLSGAFHAEEIPNIHSKIGKLLADGNDLIILHMDEVHKIDVQVVHAFLSLLNAVREKGGDLKFVFKNASVWTVFAPYRMIFPIYPDEKSVHRSGLFGKLRKRGKTLTRKTGLRISVSLAVFILVILFGWFTTLAVIINMQHQRIENQLDRIHELRQWKQKTQIEIQELKDRLKPLKDLGLVPDSVTIE